MRDGIELARRDRAVAALVTDQFWPQGHFVATSNGMPQVPRVRIPHPVAGTGHVAMAEVAAIIAPRLIAVLRGESPGDQDTETGAAA